MELFTDEEVRIISDIWTKPNAFEKSIIWLANSMLAADKRWGDRPTDNNSIDCHRAALPRLVRTFGANETQVRLTYASVLFGLDIPLSTVAQVTYYSRELCEDLFSSYSQIYITLGLNSKSQLDKKIYFKIISIFVQYIESKQKGDCADE